MSSRMVGFLLFALLASPLSTLVRLASVVFLGGGGRSGSKKRKRPEITLVLQLHLQLAKGVLLYLP